MAQGAGIGASGFGIDAKLAVHLRKELRTVPLIGVLLARAECIDEFARNIFGNFENVIALVFSFERGTPDGVNGLALLVHYIVVFEQVFAGVEVLRFYGFLRVFDTARDQT